MDNEILPLSNGNTVIFNQQKSWKEWCKNCKKNHIVILKPCPSCGIYFTPQPKSEKVYNECVNSNICDGCEAYLDHY